MPLLAVIVLTLANSPFHPREWTVLPLENPARKAPSEAPQHPSSTRFDPLLIPRNLGGKRPHSALVQQPDDGFDPASAWIEVSPNGVENLRQEIEALLQDAPSGVWSVYIEDLNNGYVFTHRSQQVLHPASTIKLAIALDLLRWLDEHPEEPWESGPPNAGRNYTQLLHALLVWSEEDAAEILTTFLDAMPDHSLNEQLQAWGATDSSVTPRRSTAKDLVKLLIRLESGELLSEENADYLLSILREPSRGDDERLGGGLPECLRTSLAHKTGTTFEYGLGVVGDVGLVRTEDVHYVIAVIGNGVEWVDFEAAKQMIAAISRSSFRAFQLLASPPPHQEEGCYLKICPKLMHDLLYCQDGLRRLP